MCKVERKVVFDLSKLDNSKLSSVGIYKITNKENGKFYIGSTDRFFNERFKEHCRYYEMYKEGTKRCMHPKLWAAYDKYGIVNFFVEILEVLDGKTSKEILQKEEYYIHTLNPEYNICLYPTNGGKPNLNRKLSDEWKQHIGDKSKLYKHSEETLKIVSENNKNNACKLEFTNIITNEILYFKSWVEASKYFNVNSPSTISNGFRRCNKWKDWNIKKLSTQTKKIKVFIEDSEIIFNSYSECDKYFQMWRGYTSELTKKKSKQLIKNKYNWELL